MELERLVVESIVNIAYGMMIFTMMACVGSQMTQEGTILMIMNGKVRYTVAINKLTIYPANGGNAIPFSRKK